MLTQRQIRFVEEYVSGLNGTQAAIRAGYSPHTARAMACENLRKPQIADAISRLSAARTRTTELDRLRVLTKLKNMAFANIRDVLNPDGTIKDPTEWSAAARDAFRPVRRKGRVIGVRSEGSLKALDLLAQHLGLFPTKRRRT